MINKRVLVKKNNYEWEITHESGKIQHNIGKIIKKEPDNRYVINFEKEFIQGHSCNGDANSKCGRYVNKSDIIIEGKDTIETFINEIKQYLPKKNNEEELIL